MKKFFSEFKEFATRGSAMDLAVGVIVGAAFTAIITALVNNILMPIIGIIIGGVDFSVLAVTVGTGEHAAVLAYGSFISAIVNFVLIMLVLFILIKSLNNLRDTVKKKETPVEPRVCPYCKQEVAEGATRCHHCTSELS
ncbi:MAG: large conductance mechanosensitive channel protein MscL [Actinobacteria bacterium]|nr:large conductance mechanosensitive channel protein MscL [Actinomycetota bacterium]